MEYLGSIYSVYLQQHDYLISLTLEPCRTGGGSGSKEMRQKTLRDHTLVGRKITSCRIQEDWHSLMNTWKWVIFAYYEHGHALH